jgi:hypothetical protein
VMAPLVAPFSGRIIGPGLTECAAQPLRSVLVKYRLHLASGIGGRGRQSRRSRRGTRRPERGNESAAEAFRSPGRCRSACSRSVPKHRANLGHLTGPIRSALSGGQALRRAGVQPGRPQARAVLRSRLMDDGGSKTLNSLQRGAMAFAEGCYAALRNPGSHDRQTELPEHHVWSN